MDIKKAAVTGAGSGLIAACTVVFLLVKDNLPGVVISEEVLALGPLGLAYLLNRVIASLRKEPT